MKTTPKRLAIIPARGGSKRIKNKNIKLFHGRPIIHYSLEYTVNSKLFDKIHVSTDSDAVRHSVSEFGINIEFQRPDHLCDDFTTLFEVIKYTVLKYKDLGESFDEIWLIMACAPLICKEDLITAAKNFNPKNKLMIAVSEMPIHASWAYEKNENGLLEFIKPEGYNYRSQDLEFNYYDAGAFAILTNDLFKKEKLITSPIQPYYLPKNRAVDIDTEDDWRFAEALYKINLKR